MDLSLRQSAKVLIHEIKSLLASERPPLASADDADYFRRYYTRPKSPAPQEKKQPSLPKEEKPHLRVHPSPPQIIEKKELIKKEEPPQPKTPPPQPILRTDLPKQESS